MRNAIKRSAGATTVLLTGMRTGLPALFGIAGVFFVAVCCVCFVGLPVLSEAVVPLRSLAAAERRRVGRVLGHDIDAPYRPVTGTWPRKALTVLCDPATWRDTAWLVGHGLTSCFTGVVAVALWPAIVESVTMPAWWWLLPRGEVTAFVPLTTWTQALTLPFAQALVEAAAVYWALPWLARAQVWFGDALLRPTAGAALAQRVEELTETRTEALEAHGAELRRIERDLHDGVQAQLVSIAVRLGLAERAFTSQPETAMEMLHDARDGIEDSLGNLRDVIRGIYPPILADRGLAGAVHALAGGQRVPVTVHVPDDLARPPAAVEAAAYFVVAESLTNVTKHSTAQHVDVTVRREGNVLLIVVRDDGQGGADQAGGSGLLGIQRRVAALDGTTRIDSPAGVGTTIEVRLPCGS
ncbi:MAG TPA: sensor domain-containing protein [Pseudonocardiaceae bacterium]|nr:sensor domain-containing protein [Pseudonocardiaceae bacterium]